MFESPCTSALTLSLYVAVVVCMVIGYLDTYSHTSRPQLSYVSHKKLYKYSAMQSLWLKRLVLILISNSGWCDVKRMFTMTEQNNTLCYVITLNSWVLLQTSISHCKLKVFFFSRKSDLTYQSFWVEDQPK